METETLEERRTAHDRRGSAWVFLVIGALVAWLAFGALTQDATVWKTLGTLGVVAGAGMVVRGLVLFQKPRP